jgi:endonuclease III
MRETKAATRARARKILTVLERTYPDAKIALEFGSPYELLVATILSAQCTDERVNTVTPGLFRRYPGPRELARATPGRLEAEIRSTGFFRAKTRSLLGMAQAVVALPGVGLKTANVVIGNAFGGDALAVDTHVFRVTQRLGLARSDDAEKLHDRLVATLPRGMLTRATHLFIVHGRRTCTARKPACPGCPVRALCPWPDKSRA